MKNTLLIIFILLGLFDLNGQTIQSSCVTQDSVLEQYREDADRLALRKIYRQNLTYRDSIVIPAIHSDTVLNALIAVYNAISLPARDTVVSMFNLHSFNNPMTNYIEVDADSNSLWMQQLKIGNIPTGSIYIDSLLSLYHLSVSEYFEFNHSFDWQQVILKSDNNYNLPPLTSLFLADSDVVYSYPYNWFGDGNNIWDSIYTDHVELTYSLGWGDCPMGCTKRRFWYFNVYFDCSVEYVGSYGSKLEFVGISDIDRQPISIYPNPFTNQFTIQLPTKEPTRLILYNSLGQEVLNQGFIHSITISTESFSKGIYVYKLIDNNGLIKTGKIVKE